MADFSLLERLAENIQVHANAKQVYAEPIERDGTTIIPVARVQWGFGGGGIGSGVAERGGGGGGVRATPAGFIEIRNGSAEFRPLRSGADIAVVAGAVLAGLVAGYLLGKR